MVTILLIAPEKRLTDTIIEAFPGDDVVVAATLSAAKTVLAVVKPVLVLVDLALPDSRGLDTLAALKPYSCPKIVLSEFENESPCEAAKIGAIDYVKKRDIIEKMLVRIKFNVEKFRPKEKFSYETFEKIKNCFRDSCSIQTANE